MKLPYPLPVKEIAERIGASLIIGDDSIKATGLNEIHKVEHGDVIFSDLEKYFEAALKSAASVIILNKESACPPGKVVLVVEDPFEAYNSLVKAFRPFIPLTANVSESAIVHHSAVIEPNAVIGHHAVIGQHCHIQANAFIGDYSVIGDYVNIQAGALIGTHAFYYKRSSQQAHKKWHTGGRVVIGDHSEIGAGCTINAGVSGDTSIGAGTKFDSQIHIGHDAVIGRDCLFAAQVGIGGNTTIGDRVVIYGQSGIAQNLTIGDDVTVLAKTGVTRNLQSGKTYFGSPAEEVTVKFKQLASLRQLPEFMRQFNKSVSETENP